MKSLVRVFLAFIIGVYMGYILNLFVNKPVTKNPFQMVFGRGNFDIEVKKYNI